LDDDADEDGLLLVPNSTLSSMNVCASASSDAADDDDPPARENGLSTAGVRDRSGDRLCIGDSVGDRLSTRSGERCRTSAMVKCDNI
jgi:hypothetical protein